MRVGSKDKARREHDLVFEDQIEFITDHIETGDLEVPVRSYACQTYLQLHLSFCPTGALWNVQGRACPCRSMRGAERLLLQDFEPEDAKTAAERERAKREAEAKSEHEKLLADRKMLPIYPYRDQLLDAVAKYQIVIIVGETGSGKTTQVSCRKPLLRPPSAALQRFHARLCGTAAVEHTCCADADPAILARGRL